MGEVLVVANSMSGNRTSAPKIALPFTFKGVSSRASGFPIKVYWPGFLMAGSWASWIVAAVLASSPYLSVRLVAV